MVHLHKDTHASGLYSKLKARNFGPCEILRKINDNAYVIDVHADFNMSSIFNVSDLRKYYPPETEVQKLRTIALGERSPDTGAS